MAEDPTASVSADSEQVRVEMGDVTVHLEPEDAETLRDDLDRALEYVGPSRIRNALWLVDGIGEQTIELLAEEFGTLEALRNASDGELEAVHGVGMQRRQKIRGEIE